MDEILDYLNLFADQATEGGLKSELSFLDIGEEVQDRLLGEDSPVPSLSDSSNGPVAFPVDGSLQIIIKTADEARPTTPIKHVTENDNNGHMTPRGIDDFPFSEIDGVPETSITAKCLTFGSCDMGACCSKVTWVKRSGESLGDRHGGDSLFTSQSNQELLVMVLVKRRRKTYI